jgi:predicted PurR-regulated permease PerM
LPTNIAPGYTNPLVEAKIDQWVSASDRWITSDRPDYNTLKLYIESPYKQLYESSQQQLQEQKASNDNLNNTVNILAVTSMAFVRAAGILTFLLFTRKPNIFLELARAPR